MLGNTLISCVCQVLLVIPRLNLFVSKRDNNADRHKALFGVASGLTVEPKGVRGRFALNFTEHPGNQADEWHENHKGECEFPAHPESDEKAGEEGTEG